MAVSTDVVGGLQWPAVMACRCWSCSKENGGVAFGLASKRSKGKNVTRPIAPSLSLPHETALHLRLPVHLPSRCNFCCTAPRLALHLSSSLLSAPDISYA